MTGTVHALHLYAYATCRANDRPIVTAKERIGQALPTSHDRRARCSGQVAFVPWQTGDDMQTGMAGLIRAEGRPDGLVDLFGNHGVTGSIPVRVREDEVPLIDLSRTGN